MEPASLEIGIVGTTSPGADSLRAALARIDAVTLHAGSLEEESERLRQGERDLVVVAPESLRAGDSLLVLADPEAKPSETQLGRLILRTILDESVLAGLGDAKRPRLVIEPVVTRNLTYMDFLIPGVIAMSIMQMGVFGVAFGFVSLKKRGILRRLSVTPLRAMDFIIAQVITRMTVLLLQMGLMLGVGVLFLNLHFAGDILSLVVLVNSWVYCVSFDRLRACRVFAIGRSGGTVGQSHQRPHDPAIRSLHQPRTSAGPYLCDHGGLSPYLPG